MTTIDRYFFNENLIFDIILLWYDPLKIKMNMYNKP